MPKLEDLHYLETEPERMESQAYDLVLNGTELGSGSIRIHDRDIQARVFRQLGLSEEDIRDRFGFLLDAFRFGTPPHGGFALGLDRLIMLLANAPSLREVIAFPKLSNASDPLTDAPSTVDRQQLDELHIVLAADVVAGSEIFSGFESRLGSAVKTPAYREDSDKSCRSDGKCRDAAALESIAMLLLASIAVAVSGGADNVKNIADELVVLIGDRNRKCKLLK